VHWGAKRCARTLPPGKGGEKYWDIAMGNTSRIVYSLRGSQLNRDVNTWADPADQQSVEIPLTNIFGQSRKANGNDGRARQQSTNCEPLLRNCEPNHDARLPRPSTTLGPRPPPNCLSFYPCELSFQFDLMTRLFFFLIHPLLVFRQSKGQGADLGPLVAFYSKLPKGSAPGPAVKGIKGRYFNGKNASASPIVFTMLAIFGLGYTIDYQSACPLTVDSFPHID